VLYEGKAHGCEAFPKWRARLRYYLGLSHLFRECPHLKPYLITFVSCCTKANLPTGGGRFPNAGLDSTMASS